MTVFATCILAMVLGLLLMMNYFKFSNILTDVTTSRLAVINKNLESSLSRATNLGLALDELQFADTLLKRAKVSDAAIQEIEVFDNNGAILFATGRQVQGGKVDPSVLRQLAPIQKPDNVEWSAHTEEQFVAGVTLFNSFDRPIGGIVLRYNREGYISIVEIVLKDLFTVTGGLLAIAALIAGLGISLGFRELRHTYASMQAALARVRASETTDIKATAENTEDIDFRAKLGTVTATVDDVLNQIEASAVAPGNQKA
jgi:hypothetical protein